MHINTNPIETEYINVDQDHGGYKTKKQQFFYEDRKSRAEWIKGNKQTVILELKKLGISYNIAYLNYNNGSFKYMVLNDSVVKELIYQEQIYCIILQ